MPTLDKLLEIAKRDLGARVTVVTAIEPRPTAHDAIRHCADLISALNEAAQFPNVVTDGDKDVLRYRLKQLVNAVEAVIV